MNVFQTVCKTKDLVITRPSPLKPQYEKEISKLVGEIFDNSSQTYAKADMKVFWSCPILLDFLTFWQNILLLTVGRAKKTKKKQN